MKRTLFPFARGGFSHELVEQCWPVCLVKRTKGGRQLHWEVVILQQHEAVHWPNGDFTPPGWHYPSIEQWGEAGWTFADFADARRHYDRCCCLRESQKRGVSAVGRVKIADGEQNAPQGQEETCAA
jgi:hypothetical protein